VRPEAALYLGWVRHRRFLPKAHAFRYPLFLAWLDIDRMDSVAARTALFSVDCFNVLAFHEADYLPGWQGRTLRERLSADAALAGRLLPEGRIYLLTNLRTLGMGFNPVSYYYAFDAEDRLAMVIAEVTNTPWKERVTYWMDLAEGTRGEDAVSFEVAKAMHVSPFNPMALRYRWTFTQPRESLTVRMALFEADAFFFDVDLELERRPWSSSELARTLFRFPFMTLQVVLAIHWEALCLWIKRVPVHTHPKKAAKAAP
jgi:uncharacterized protein